ncbi:Sec-independent protein translocase protein TatB [Acinetobacter sp. ANC 5378]|uniref:Sec-independent protein translocase protein TatB n=1 Tax=Acinetobacter sp. ANC 5378 TaxID=2731249 RepID=UPI00148F8583|nr:Sec-independent protein translocase protein TatB [Acinetobacter sp. ANC 5378]NNG81607.1 twin-arginine translocase subunit TatB [Acinetobacter sp. ANC 5378]
MFNVSFGEIFAFSIIALIILGPEKFPQVLRQVMLKYRGFKSLVQKVQQDIEEELELGELKQFMQQELQRIKDNEAQLQASLLEMQAKIDQQQYELNVQVQKNKSHLYEPVSSFSLVPFRQAASISQEVKKAI